MPLIECGAVVADRYAMWNGEGTPPFGDLLVPPNVALQRVEIFNGRRIGVTLENTTDPSILMPILRRLSLVALVFPVFRDGRAYTQAAILREVGFRGKLRATGSVYIDQIPFMSRVGFDTFLVDETVAAADIAVALNRYRRHYQYAPGDALRATPNDDTVEAAA